MPHHMGRVAICRLALTLLPALAAVGLPARAAAATITPESGTTCYGSLKHDSTGASQGEPNLLGYRFVCDTNVVAYSIVVNRDARWPTTIDDFDPNPLVVQQDGTVSSTESPGCSGTIPGDGINCNIGAGNQIGAFNEVKGSIDPTGPYCAYYPSDAKPGSRPLPEAEVELIVSDYTGAEDGPFPLGLAHACPAPEVLKAKPKKGKHKGVREAGIATNHK